MPPTCKHSPRLSLPPHTHAQETIPGCSFVDIHNIVTYIEGPLFCGSRHMPLALLVDTLSGERVEDIPGLDLGAARALNKGLAAAKHRLALQRVPVVVPAQEAHQPTVRGGV